MAAQNLINTVNSIIDKQYEFMDLPLFNKIENMSAFEDIQMKMKVFSQEYDGDDRENDV